MNYILAGKFKLYQFVLLLIYMKTWVTHEQRGHRRLVSSWDQIRRLRQRTIRPPHQREGATQTTCTGQFLNYSKILEFSILNIKTY